VIKISNGTSFEVQAVAGDDHLGGEDFDNRLVNHFTKEFTRQFKSDLTKNPRSLQRLRTACERAKRVLSSTKEASIEIDNLYDGHDFSSKITRARFELLCMDLFESTMAPVAQALSDANLQKQQIDEVVMVGGSTRIPKIQELLSSFFKDRKINFTINPDEAIAYGAAVQAAILTEIYCSQIQNIRLFDVVPLSLGISVENERIMSTIIEKNSRVPCKKTNIYLPLKDFQTEITITIFEGERYKAFDNYLLGEFQITGLTSALRGVTEINVTFDLDTDGILTVTAKELGKENEKEIKIDKKNGRLTSADVRQMLADAEKYRKLDEKFKEKAEARQQLDMYILRYERAAACKSTFMTVKSKEKIRKICGEKSLWLDSNQDAEKELIVKQLEDLKKAFYGIV
jgi:heat shock 70kDa protein 1/2/6/8